MTFDLTALKITSYEDIRPYIDELLAREVMTAEDTNAWIVDYDMLQSRIEEDSNWRYVNLSRDTENADYKRAYELFTQEILLHLQPADDLLNRKIVSLPGIDTLVARDQGYAIWYRGVKSALDLYREESVPLQVQLADLAMKYGEIAGAMTVDHDGKTITLQQAAVYVELPDRAVRKEVYEKVWGRRMQDSVALDSLLTEMIGLRDQVARNAGYDNFATYMRIAKDRFDYTQQHAFDFHAGVREHIVPLLTKWRDEKRIALGLDSLRPYDLQVQGANLEALKPFSTGKELLKIGTEVMRDVDSQFGRNIEIMNEEGRFDLDSRPGKQPGGYNCSMPVSHYPFIFMNAAGTQGDVETFVHEAGHAMHSFCMNEAHLPLNIFKHYPIEFAEVASMSMELMTRDFWSRFYVDRPADLARAQRLHLEDALETVSWVAVIDSFQYWLYTNPTHSVAGRDEKFSKLLGIYQPWIDYSEHRDVMKKRRQAQLHIFEMPFYYLEYAIAGLGALGVWQNYMHDPIDALQKYKKGLSLGYTKPLPELFTTVGIPFDFGPARLQELAKFCEEMRG